MAANHRYFTFEAPLICQRLPGTTVKDDRSISDPCLKFIYSEKATKILQNLHRRFVLCSVSQIYSGDFAKFYGLLRIFELYNCGILTRLYQLFTACKCFGGINVLAVSCIAFWRQT